MKIGINGNEANVENRVGVNQYAANLLINLENLKESRQHEFTIFLESAPLPHLPKEREGWRYRLLSGRGMWIMTSLMPYLLTVRNKPDVLFTPSHYSPPISIVPTIISIMDLGYLSSREQFKLKDFIQLKYWTAGSIKQAKKIIAISESTKREIAENYPNAEKKTEVTLLAYDKNQFKYQISNIKINEVKKKYGIKGDYLLFLSTLKPSKNVEGIINAFSHLSSLPLTLVIGGKKGWLYEKIFAQVESLALQDKVIFTDFVPEEDKPALVAGASVFLAPSFWEGFGIHVLEAMGVGTPVVCSGVGSFPEVGGKAAIYVDPHNPEDIASGIREAIKDHDKLRDLGLSQAKNFSWQKTALQTLKILQEAA